MPGLLFHESGPSYLKKSSIDWGNDFHRTSVAASLVQGVYSLERARQRQFKHDPNSSLWWEDYNASQWWEALKFRLRKILIDDKDSSCIGAIYQNLNKDASPRYVIAFRGTLAKRHTIHQDLKLNFKCVLAAKLQKSSRFCIAFEAVSNIVSRVGPANVWLAGHSLGASIAMMAGKNMAKLGINLETYVFNPTFISLPIELLIKNKLLKRVVRVANSLNNAPIVTTINKQRWNPNVLSKWTPYVFANPNDPISAEYIGYFQHRERMEDMGFGVRFTTEYSIASLVSAAIGRDVEPLHIVPTAHMTVNTNPSKKFREAHGIDQWWNPDLQLHSKLYIYKFKEL